MLGRAAFLKPEPWGRRKGKEGLPGPESPRLPPTPKLLLCLGAPSLLQTVRVTSTLPLPPSAPEVGGERLGPPAISMDRDFASARSSSSSGKKRRKVCVDLHLGDPSPS